MCPAVVLAFVLLLIVVLLFVLVLVVIVLLLFVVCRASILVLASPAVRCSCCYLLLSPPVGMLRLRYKTPSGI